MNKPHQCPVCLGFTLERPYEPLSYDICPRCGIEYGLEDSVSNEDWNGRREEAIADKHAELRRMWEAAGSPNWDAGGDVSRVPWLQPASAGRGADDE